MSMLFMKAREGCDGGYCCTAMEVERKENRRWNFRRNEVDLEIVKVEDEGAEMVWPNKHAQRLINGINFISTRFKE